IVLMHWTDKSQHNYKDNAAKIVTRTKDPVALLAKIKAAGMTITRDYTPSAQVGGASVGLAKDPDGYVLEILPLKGPAAQDPSGLSNAAPVQALMGNEGSGGKAGGGMDGGGKTGGDVGGGKADGTKDGGGKIGNSNGGGKTQ